MDKFRIHGRIRYRGQICNVASNGGHAFIDIKTVERVDGEDEFEFPRDSDLFVHRNENWRFKEEFTKSLMITFAVKTHPHKRRTTKVVIEVQVALVQQEPLTQRRSA